jgi:hypothetical protein
LINSPSIRTAKIADVVGIVFVRGKRPDEGVIALARDLAIPVMATELGMFDVCGLLYAKGIRGVC